MSSNGFDSGKAAKIARELAETISQSDRSPTNEDFAALWEAIADIHELIVLLAAFNAELVPVLMSLVPEDE